jgi:hypothetical protein
VGDLQRQEDFGVARWHIFKPKIQIWVHFGGSFWRVILEGHFGGSF